MLRKIAAAAVLLAVLAIQGEAASPEAVKLKGEGLKNFNAYEMDGSFYTVPAVLARGNKWKVSWDSGKLYACLVPQGLTEEEKVEIPFQEINGQKYVDISYFGQPAGLEYDYKEKKKELAIKVRKEKKGKPSSKKDEAKPLMPLVLWDVEDLFDPETSGFMKLTGQHILSPSAGSYKDFEENRYHWNFDYLKQMKNGGVEVMPLVHNDFDVEETSRFMHDAKKQKAFISQIAALAEVYGLYGYNMDFENMDPKDKELYTAFMGNLALPLHAAGKKLTVDITVYNAGSPYWSLCYDREKLADFCDYEIVMGYDETPRISDSAGSVSSFGWLEQNIKKLATMVPEEKLILGLPFYTRIYSGNRGHVKSRVLTMKNEESLVQKIHGHPVWDEKARQYVLSWKEGGIPSKVYLEEGKSMAAKMELLSQYGLSGLAFWRHGFEKYDVYRAMEGKLRHDEIKKADVPKADSHKSNEAAGARC